jgi:hypothetical protein
MYILILLNVIVSALLALSLLTSCASNEAVSYAKPTANHFATSGFDILPMRTATESVSTVRALRHWKTGYCYIVVTTPSGTAITETAKEVCQ